MAQSVPGLRHLFPRRAAVGLAKGIEALKLYRFVRSLRDSTGDPSVSGIDVVLFLDEADAPPGSPLEWVLTTFGVIVKSFNPASFPEERHRGYHPSSYRWMLIRDWMRSLPAAQQYASVLFTDVRDAVFQGDPFAAAATAAASAPGGAAAGAGAGAPHPQHPVFMAFLEAKPRTIAECGWNAGWVRDCFGEAGLQSVGNNVISCSGTSLGTWESALAYANLLADEIAVNKCERNGELELELGLDAEVEVEAPALDCIHIHIRAPLPLILPHLCGLPHVSFRASLSAGVDQGMHNYYVFNGKLASALQPLGSRLQVVDNEQGFVATVQSMGVLKRDRAGRLLNDDGKPYALVHQYDRSQALEQQYDRQFVWLSDDALTIHK